MRTRLKELLSKLHHSQSGAIALLCLAGLLIIFLTAMLMYDAGEAARDKMDVQIGADTAALSSAAVKSRSMNMVAYSNITKRILYGYNTIYTAALLALIETTGYYLYEAGKNAAQAIKTAPACATVVGCAVPIGFAVVAIDNAITAVKGILQLIFELIEFSTVNGARLFGFPTGSDTWRSAKEVTALDYYQEYMVKMQPWWSWGEAVTRGMRNGATLVGTFPIPNGEASRLRNKIRFGLNALGSVFDSVPAPDDLVSTTSKTDSMPVEQIPEFMGLGPFFSGIGVPKFVAHAKMCSGVLFSPEFWLMQYYMDHWRPSEGYWDDTHKPLGAKFAPRTLITLLEIAQMPVGCVFAALTLGHEVLPYDLKASVQSSPTALFGSTTPDNWLSATMNVAFGYKRGQGRFDDDARRSKMSFMTPDYQLAAGETLFRNDGYWAISKAEIMYDTGLVGELSSGISPSSVPAPFGAMLSGALNVFSNWFNEPGMFAPRWTARARPLALPNEGNDGALDRMDAMFHDQLPFMALTTPLALAYGEGGDFPALDDIANLPDQANSAISFLKNFGRDIVFMEMASDGYPVGVQQSGAWEK